MVTNPTKHSTMANGHATSQLRRTLEHTNDHQTPHTMELDLVRKALDVCHTKAAKRTRRRMHVARFTIQVARRNGWSLNLPALATLILGHAPTQEMRHPKTIMWEISRWQTCLLLSLGSLDLETSCRTSFHFFGWPHTLKVLIEEKDNWNSEEWDRRMVRCILKIASMRIPFFSFQTPSCILYH